MGGEYYIKVKGAKARKIVIEALNHFERDEEDKWWVFPSYCYAKCEKPKTRTDRGALPGLQVIEERRKGYFQFSYSIWADDEPRNYIYAICAEIRKKLKKEGMDFTSFGNTSLGEPYRRQFWEPVMDLGYHKYEEEQALNDNDDGAYYKKKLEFRKDYRHDTVAKMKMLTFLLQKRMNWEEK